MWLNQNFLLPEGVDTPDVTFTSLRAGGLLSINMAASGQVPQRSRLCFRGWLVARWQAGKRLA